MTLNEILLVCAALLPALILCVYVYKKDKAEKEPFGLLALLLVGGVIICFPAAELEVRLLDFIERFFIGFAQDDGTGVFVLGDIGYKLYIATQNFLGIALVEEGLKLAVLLLITRKSPHFNSLFDGIIYAVFVSLGFAAFENVLYVLENGWLNAIMRGILSVPGHAFFGVIMGYYYSWWHIYKKADENENAFKKMNIIFDGDRIKHKRFLCLSLFVPVLLHGYYDYCCNIGTLSGTLGLYALVLVLYFYCFAKIRKMSSLDTSSVRVSARVLLLTHPTLVTVLEEKGIQTSELTDEDALNEIIRSFED